VAHAEVYAEHRSERRPDPGSNHAVKLDLSTTEVEVEGL
jgi:hypothetical protein